MNSPNLNTRSDPANPRAGITGEDSAFREHRWLAELAEPYLRGYTAAPANDGDLGGYWFASPLVSKSAGTIHEPDAVCGFFAGYLKSPSKYQYLRVAAPECLVFAWFSEPGGAEHARLVAGPGSLLHKVHTYIGWLTHRPPRFELFTDQFIALIRHRTMLDWPVEKREHYSRNFFIETLAWLVRSGLVKKLKSGEGNGLDV